MKKILSFVLSIAMIFTMSSTASAASISSSVEILTNTDTLCVVQENTSAGKTVATNNKQTGILTIEKYDAANTLISTETLDLAAINSGNFSDETFASPRAADYDYIYQHTFSNREYDLLAYHNGSNYWTLRSGDNNKSMFQTASNQGNLNNFREAVNNVNTAEFQLGGVVGSGLLIGVIAAFLSGGTAAGIAAAGGVAGAGVALGNLDSAISNADYWYSQCR